MNCKKKWIFFICWKLGLCASFDSWMAACAAPKWTIDVCGPCIRFEWIFRYELLNFIVLFGDIFLYEMEIWRIFHWKFYKCDIYIDIWNNQAAYWVYFTKSYLATIVLLVQVLWLQCTLLIFLYGSFDIANTLIRWMNIIQLQKNANAVIELAIQWFLYDLNSTTASTTLH